MRKVPPGGFEPNVYHPPSRSYLASPLGRLKTLLREGGIHVRKELGQNFLVDEELLDQILAAAELTAAERAVEVGPGPGVLTERLLAVAGSVVAVEVDPALANLLRRRFGAQAHFQLIEGDILKVPTATFAGGWPAYKVVANLPYYITSPVLRHFLEATPKPVRLVVMVQKEVAERIVAPPGRLSLLGVSVQLYGRPEIVARAPAAAFFPPPKVDSAVVRIDVYDRTAVDVPDVERFFELVHAGFSQPRKQLHNALGRHVWLPPGGASRLLEAAGIDPERRAQTLRLEEWAALAAAQERLFPQSPLPMGEG
jgi:16S rRNA (adenine1518-N6/adenine1519-N6)-dimethyltransferase